MVKYDRAGVEGKRRRPAQVIGDEHVLSVRVPCCRPDLDREGDPRSRYRDGVRGVVDRVVDHPRCLGHRELGRGDQEEVDIALDAVVAGVSELPVLSEDAVVVAVGVSLDSQVRSYA